MEKDISKKKNFNMNNLEFESEYLYGKKHGKGKEYNFNGDLIFEGEYINGKRYKLKEYNDNKN